MSAGIDEWKYFSKYQSSYADLKMLQADFGRR